MQPFASTLSTSSYCYLQIRRKKQTIFTNVAENTTVAELKQTVADIFGLDPETLRLSMKDRVLDDGSKPLGDYGITLKTAQPQRPVQLEVGLQLENGTYENDEIIPYATDNHGLNEDSPCSMNTPIDAR